ncbi:unnamed protein product, partial [Prorocentrum cordatum]
EDVERATRRTGRKDEADGMAWMPRSGCGTSRAASRRTGWRGGPTSAQALRWRRWRWAWRTTPSFCAGSAARWQAALYEASAAFLLNLAVLSLNHAERLVPLRRFYLLKAGLTAAVIRVMLQGRGDRGRRPTLWSTTPATGAPPSAAPSQRPACSRTAPGAPSSGPRLGPRALPARSGSPSSSDPRGGAAAVARRVGAAATPARPLSDIRRPLEASCFVFHPASG